MRTIYGYVYLVRNRVSGKVYIGQTTMTVDYRWRKHKTHARKRGTIFASALRGYGPDTFDVVELGRAFSSDELNEMEKRAIWSHDATDIEYGYNMEPGGNFTPVESLRGRKFSEEHRANISKALTGRKRSPEECAKNGDAKRGTKASDATRAKLSAAGKGRVVSIETRAKKSAALMGKKRSEECRARLRAAWVLRKYRMEAKISGV